MPPQIITVSNWQDATRRLTDFVEPCDYTLGSGYDYPSPFAVFTKDAWSGEGMGYTIWTTKDGKLEHIAASIEIK